MRSRVLTALLTAGLTAVGVATAPAASAAPCTITDFSPRSVTVGLTPVTATFKVSTAGCSLRRWSVDDDGFQIYAYNEAPQETFNPWSNRYAGAMDVIASATSEDYAHRERVFAGGFTLKRATTFQQGTFNASPEPVRRGAPVTLTGRLLIANWDTDQYGPWGNRPVDVQFRTPGGTYQTVATVNTDRSGWVRTTVPAGHTGYWRLRYGGNSAAGRAVTAGDAVEIR